MAGSCQSINIRFNITKDTTADTAATEVIKTRKRSGRKYERLFMDEYCGSYINYL